MMRPMTYIEELENALVELLGAICETDDDAELASLTRQYEYWFSWQLPNLKNFPEIFSEKRLTK